jgi:hypothetical protein
MKKGPPEGEPFLVTSNYSAAASSATGAAASAAFASAFCFL